MTIEINLQREQCLALLEAGQYTVALKVESFPSRYGGEDYKTMINYVYDRNGELATQDLDRPVERDYYINLVVQQLFTSALVSNVKKTLLHNQK